MFISASANTFTSASANMFTSDLASMFTIDLTNMFTSELANMFISDLAKIFTMFTSELEKKKMIWPTCSLVKLTGEYIDWPGTSNTTLDPIFLIEQLRTATSENQNFLSFKIYNKGNIDF